MNIWANVRLALKALNSNKTRTALTLLGMIIGTAAVIAVMSIGRGAQASILNRIQSAGSNLIYVRSGASTQGGVRGAVGSAPTLTLQDAQALTSPGALSNVTGVSPEQNSRGQAIVGSNNVAARVIGVTSQYLGVHNYTLADGDFISDQNVQSTSSVIVLGSNIANTLFPDTSPIGQSVRINRWPFRVVGVLQSQGGGSLGILDDTIMMPITTVMTRLEVRRTTTGAQNVDVITLQAADSKSIDAAKAEISDVLRQRHRLPPDGSSDDFNVTTQQDLLNTLTQATNTFTVFLGAIAGISLVVGGIGIMNIMLVSVAERTREIGLRKAIGAKRRHILSQFLIEAVVLSGLGGATGVALGIGLSRGVSRINLNGQNLPSVITPDIIILAAGVSLIIGLFFGIYPAARASRLDPIQALRHE